MIEAVTTTTAELPWNLQFLALVWSTIAQFYFWSLYSGVKWNKHYVGKALFGQGTALLFVFIVIVTSRALEFPGEAWLRVVSYFSLSLALTFQAYALWKQQHSEKVTMPKEDEL